MNSNTQKEETFCIAINILNFVNTNFYYLKFPHSAGSSSNSSTNISYLLDLQILNDTI